LAAPRPRDVRRGHKHPRGKKRLLRNGPELEDALACKDTEFPRPSAGCSWPALTGGLWHFWVLVRQAPQSVAAEIRHRVSLRPCQMDSRRSKRRLLGTLSVSDCLAVEPTCVRLSCTAKSSWIRHAAQNGVSDVAAEALG